MFSPCPGNTRHTSRPTKKVLRMIKLVVMMKGKKRIKCIYIWELILKKKLRLHMYETMYEILPSFVIQICAAGVQCLLCCLLISYLTFFFVCCICVWSKTFHHHHHNDDTIVGRDRIERLWRHFAHAEVISALRDHHHHHLHHHKLHLFYFAPLCAFKWVLKFLE